MATDITQTDYPRDPETGKVIPLSEISNLPWMPTTIDVHPWLGYPKSVSQQQSGNGETRIETSHPYITQVHYLVANLQRYDELLLDSAEDSVASELGELKISFNRQMANINKAASRILESLSLLVEVPIRHNKYATMKVSSYSVRCPV